jgi:ribosomal-protein-alanine N-acetyltransferase
MRYRIRRMKTGDADSVHHLVCGIPEAAQWTTKDFVQAAQGALDAWVAENDDEIAAFLISRRVADEIEILDLAVAPGSRRQGIASRLVASALEEARNEGVQRAFLEVRASNSGAIEFYGGAGFRAIGSRKRYYTNPPDDALLMTVDLR